MNISEKLKVISDTGWKALRPEVVAVVEKAERTTEVWYGPGGTGMLNASHSHQRDALAALEEALT